ncbi:Uncharacterized protein HZ326_6208 [Fusarium oxysporum f. sp. albedinis]|nr:Uncharacterized protein HZ326_6208 [Fusarium oxysporum f. sp. albedinis]
MPSEETPVDPVLPGLFPRLFDHPAAEQRENNGEYFHHVSVSQTSTYWDECISNVPHVCISVDLLHRLCDMPNPSGKAVAKRTVLRLSFPHVLAQLKRPGSKPNPLSKTATPRTCPMQNRYQQCTSTW